MGLGGEGIGEWGEVCGVGGVLGLRGVWGVGGLWACLPF